MYSQFVFFLRLDDRGHAWVSDGLGRRYGNEWHSRPKLAAHPYYCIPYMLSMGYGPGKCSSPPGTKVLDLSAIPPHLESSLNGRLLSLVNPVVRYPG